jgi:hypothetical protein
MTRWGAFENARVLAGAVHVPENGRAAAGKLAL